MRKFGLLIVSMLVIVLVSGKHVEVGSSSPRYANGAVITKTGPLKDVVKTHHKIDGRGNKLLIYFL